MKKKILKTQKQVVEFTKMNPALYNPREITAEAKQSLEHSIDDFGFVEDIVWNKRTGNIVSGHQRFKIAQTKGYTSAQVTVVDLDEIEEKALNAHMNNRLAQGTFTAKITDIIEEIKSQRPDLHDRMRLFDVRSEEEENNDDGETPQQKIEKERLLKELEIRPFEHWDYLAVVFDNQNDWMNVCTKLGLEQREISPTPQNTKVGLGRILTGSQLVKILKLVPDSTQLKEIING